MRWLSSTRVLFVLLLLMSLSGIASIWMARYPAVPTLVPSSQALRNRRADYSGLQRADSAASLWQRAELQLNPVVLIAYALNLGLTFTVFVLLRRYSRYRQTLFAKAFRSSPVSITISTLDEGRYLDVNHAFLQMLGYERREVIGQTAKDLGVWAVPEDRERMLEHLGTSSVSKGIHTRFRTRTGDLREANVSAEIIDVDGVPCVLAVTQDVTESLRLENQLRQAQRMGAVGRLAGGVAHDFNNILTVIMGYSELSAFHLGPNHGVAKHLAEIKTAAERAASLTRQLLAFSRQQVLYPRILDLNNVVHNLMRMLLRLIGEDISLSFKAGIVGNIRADSGQVEQILMNLVVNARDAMPHGGTVAIETSSVNLEEGYVDSRLSVRPGRYVMMSVSDTGCGMDEKIAAQIFEPFFTTKGPGQGTGLGLSTVYGIVKQSDGYIWVYSEPERGTTFKIYFPEQQQSVAKSSESAPVLDLSDAKETVLVVEDDEALRRLIVAVLESSGYKVLQAPNGKTALDLLRDSPQQIDIVLTDMLMPVMSGIELTSELRKIRPGLKVLLMSGYAGDLIARYRVAESEIVLLEKPFTRQGLLAKLRAALQ